MKRIITICLLAAGMYACNNGTGDAKTVAKAEPTQIAKADPTDSPEFQKGLDLIKNSDCATCHKIDERLIGPGFREIANRYPNTPETIDTLAHKIIKGGQGNWGSIPMAAHDNLPLEDARSLAKYVLLLKNN